MVFVFPFSIVPSCPHIFLSISSYRHVKNFTTPLVFRPPLGKPHPRWADPNYYDGDASDKWHTRSQKRNTAAKRRPASPGANAVSVKTEPINEQTNYYRLTPSPPLSSAVGQGQGNGAHPFVNVSVATGQPNPAFAQPQGFENGASPVNYSPSSPAGYGSCGESGSSSSSAVNGGYHYPMSNNRKSTYPGAQTNGRDRGMRDANGYHRYDDTHIPNCPCLTNPAAGHSFVTLARQLDSIQNCLQQLPEHNQHTHCNINRRIQELRSILQ